MMKKEFEKHPDNPYNKKNTVAYNYKKEDGKVKEEVELPEEET